MSDVLLVQPPIRDFYLTAKRTIPYGLACIAASLEAAGFSVTILDALASPRSRRLNIPDEMAYLSQYYPNADISPFGLFHEFKHFGYSFEHIGKQAKASGAWLVGISSLFTAYSAEALHTADVVKAWLPSCRIVMGGHHPTAMPAQEMRCESVDYVIRGEGEASLPQLAEILKTTTTPSESALAEIPGIVFRKQDGALHISPPTWIENLDDTPLPALHLITGKHYRRNRRASTVIVAARGCPMTCSYCSLGKNAPVPYRRRGIASVLAEMERALYRDHAGFIDFEDENLSLDRNWFMTLLSEIHTRFSGTNLELRAMNGLFPASLDNAMVSAMKSAGFKTLNLSLGSSAPDQQRRFHRPDLRTAFEQAVNLAETYEMTAVGYIIAGAPFQNPQDSVDDLLYLASQRVLAGVSIYYPSPGSDDYRLCQKLNILPEHLSRMRATALPLSHTTSRLEAVTLLRLGRLLNFMKSMKDQDIEFTDHSATATRHFPAIPRQEAGIQLVRMFLKDGRLRGITPDGDMYEPPFAMPLTLRFRDGIRSCSLKGVTHRSSSVLAKPVLTHRPDMFLPCS